MRLIRGVVMEYKFCILLYQIRESVMRFMLGQWCWGLLRQSKIFSTHIVLLSSADQHVPKGTNK